MTDKKQGYQPETGITTGPPNCGSGVQLPKEDRVLIYIPKDGNYIEILGHRIDGFESFETFLDHLKMYVVLEETVKAQKAEIEKLNRNIELLAICKKDLPQKTTEAIKAEAVKEVLEKLKEKAFIMEIPFEANADKYLKLVAVGEIDNFLKEMVGENNAT